MTQGWNSELSNVPFANKKPRLAAHALRLNADYFSRDIEKWNEAAIQARSRLLIDRILEIWPHLGGGEVASKDSPDQSAKFHANVVARLSEHFGTSFKKQTNRKYVSEDKAVHIVCAVASSRLFGGALRYWFAFHFQEKTFLESGSKGYAAFGCGSAQNIMLLPGDVLVRYTDDMSKSEKSRKEQHWNAVLFEQGGRFFISQKGSESKVDVTQYVLPTLTESTTQGE